MKDVSCRENLGSFYQITLRQSVAKLEVKLLGSSASSLSFLILSAPIAMALYGIFRGLTVKSLLSNLLPTPVASHRGKTTKSYCRIKPKSLLTYAMLTITVVEFNVIWIQSFLQLEWTTLLIFAYTFENENWKRGTESMELYKNNSL